jgi:hypothetical protein
MVVEVMVEKEILLILDMLVQMVLEVVEEAVREQRYKLKDLEDQVVLVSS